MVMKIVAELDTSEADVQQATRQCQFNSTKASLLFKTENCPRTSCPVVKKCATLAEPLGARIAHFSNMTQPLSKREARGPSLSHGSSSHLAANKSDKGPARYASLRGLRLASSSFICFRAAGVGLPAGGNDCLALL